MPVFTNEELKEMDALNELFIMDYNNSETNEKIEFEDLQVYANFAYSYKLKNPDAWSNDLKSAKDQENEDSEECQPVLLVEGMQEKIQALVEAKQQKSIDEYKKNNKEIPNSANKYYDDIVPLEARHLVLKGDFYNIVDTVIPKIKKEFENREFEIGEARDDAISKLKPNDFNQEANLEAQLDDKYQEYGRQISQLEEQAKNIKEQFKESPESYKKLIEDINKSIKIAKQNREEHLSRIMGQLYNKQAEDIAEKQKQIDNEFNLKSNELKKEMKDKIEQALKDAVTEKISAENKKLENKTKVFKDEKLIPLQKQNIEEANNKFDKSESEINDVHFMKDEIEDNKPLEKMDDKGQQINNEKKSAFEKAKSLVQYEVNLNDLIINKIKINARGVNTNFNKGFMDDSVNPNSGDLEIKSYKAAWERELNCVKDTFSADRDNFRVAYFDHFDRINGIHKLLKTNKKTGLTKNTTEYKAVLNQLDIYEKGLIEKGWYDVVKAEKEGKELTQEQKKLKAEMLTQLDNVFNSAANYMVKKGPQKKTWGHGQMRYDLMYLLCDEIYTRGGHAAEAMSRIKRIDDEIRSHKIQPSTYLHQITNASKGGDNLRNTYKTRINEAINGTARVPGTKKEIENKRASYLNKNNNDNNIIRASQISM